MPCPADRSYNELVPGFLEIRNILLAVSDFRDAIFSDR